MVDDRLGRVARHRAHDGREVAGRDAELLGVVGHLALLAVVGADQRHEAGEDLLLTRGVLRRTKLLARQAQHAVVSLQQGILQPILDDDVAEAVLAVAVRVVEDLQPQAELLVSLAVELSQGVRFQQAHELDRDAVGRLGEELRREGEKARLEVGRALSKVKNRAGQQEERLATLERVVPIVHHQRGAPLAAKNHGACFEAAAMVFEEFEVAFADRELLAGNHMKRILYHLFYIKWGYKDTTYFQISRIFVPKSANRRD